MCAAENSSTGPRRRPVAGGRVSSAVLSCCSFHSRHRSRGEAHGYRRKRASSSALYGRSGFGTIHGGVRWNTVSCAAISAISGTTCTPLAPVPITATRLPVRSTVASHCAVCISVAGEVGETLDVGVPRGAEQSDGADDDVGDDGSAVVELAPPSVRLVRSTAPVRTERVEHQVAAQVEIVGDRLEVGEDLRLIGVGAGPRPVRRERERIEVALDVACRTGIDVLPPRAADTIGTFDDQQVVDASAPQRHRGGQSAEAGPDDHHPRRTAPAQRQHPAGQVSAGSGHRGGSSGWTAGFGSRTPPVRRVSSTSSRMSAYSVGLP